MLIMPDDLYKLMTDQDFHDFFVDYRDEVEGVVSGRIGMLSMEEAALFYGLTKSDAHESFCLGRATKVDHKK